MREYSDGNTNVFIRWLDRKYKKRLIEERRIRQTTGNHSKKSFLYRIDRMLDYSGIRNMAGSINAEMYIVLVGTLAVFAGIIGMITFHSIFFAFSAAIIIILLSGIILYILSGIYYNRLENEIMTFLNLVENFSKTDNDIVQIFKKALFYLDEPLKGLLLEFCNEAESIGDTAAAFNNLSARIEHAKCRELFRNLQVCSKYEANYDEVIKDCRMSMIDYLAVKADRKAIINNGRAEIVILIISAVGIIFLFSGITSDLWNVLINTFIGNIILFYCFVILAICMVMMIVFDKRG